MNIFNKSVSAIIHLIVYIYLMFVAQLSFVQLAQNYLQIDGITLKLHPYKITLIPPQQNENT